VLYLQPTRLFSPEMVLKLRKGNSYEMATLLCSILIGFGFPALVVSGYATREMTTNDQRRVACPYIPKELVTFERVEEADPKYKLKDRLFLKSRFLMQVEQKRLDAENEILAEANEKKRLELEELERPPPDPQHGFRSHAWVVMIKNVPWCHKSEFKSQSSEDNDDDDGDERSDPMAFFIEPSTGFRHEVFDACFQGIESIWNHQNYYVNRQYPKTSISEMKWDLGDNEKWERFLPGEPFELRRKEKQPDVKEGDEVVVAEVKTEEDILDVEKHLDMPFSWVNLLHISAVDFEERYLGGEKKEMYKYAVYDKFAPYRNVDGLMKRLTLFETLEYQNPLVKYEWYENRGDGMKSIKRDLKTDEIVEEFRKGRPDSLKTFIHYPDDEREVILKFHSVSRFDCMKETVFHSTFIEEHYENRRDL